MKQSSLPTALLAIFLTLGSGLLGSGLLGSAPLQAYSGQVTAAECAVEILLSDAQGDAVDGATASLVRSGQRRTSDQSGRVCFELLDGSDQLVVTAEGFAVLTRSLPEAVVKDRQPLRLQLVPAFGEAIVVSATRSARRLVEVPVHIQQIDRSDIDASAARTLAEAVEYTSGLRVESNCQNCNTSQLRMLGLEGPYSQILVDGQPSVSSLAMVYGLEQIPQRLLDGIEVVKGGGSAIYGANAVGGTVNLLPHQADHTHVEIDGSATSISGSNGGETGHSLTALADWGTSGLGDGGRQRALTVYGQLDFVPAADVDGDAFSEVARRELEAGGVRGDLFVLDDRARLSADWNRTSGFRRGGDLERFHLEPHQTSVTEQIATTRNAASLRFLHTANKRFDYRLALSWAQTERDSYYGVDFDPDAYGTTRNPTMVADSQLNHYFEHSTLTWGLQWSRDQVDDVQLAFDRVLSEDHQSFALFLQDDRKLGKRLSVLWGARVDDHSALADPIVSPRAAVLWSPRSNVTVRASLAHGFRPPVTFNEDLHIELVGGGVARVSTNDPDLTEESSRSYLLSAEWRPTIGRRGSGAFEVVAFRTELEDLFFHLEADNPSTDFLEILNVNLGAAEVEGFELSGAFRWGSRVSLDLGWVAQTARFDRPEPDFGGIDFYRTPERYGNASLRLELPRQVELFFGMIYTGSMQAPHYAGFIEEDRLEETPSFLTADLNLRRSFSMGSSRRGEGRELEVTVGGRNITDQYQRDLDQGPLRDPSYVYGPRFPRSWFVNLGLRF